MVERMVGELVTLSGLVGAAHLNGTVVVVVAPEDAPKRPAAGRVAVRLHDNSVLSVKEANVVPGAPVSTRVVVRGEMGSAAYELAMSSGSPATGTVLAKLDAGAVLVLLDDGNEVEVQCGNLQAAATVGALSELYELAEEGRQAAQAATMMGSSERKALRGKMAASIDAARRLRLMCDHPSQKSMAALTELELLRHSSDAEMEAMRPRLALDQCDRALALARDRPLWLGLPPPDNELAEGLHRSHGTSVCLVLLNRVRLLDSHPSLRGEADTDELLLQHLHSAMGAAKAVEDQQAVKMVLEQRIILSCRRPPGSAASAAAVASSLLAEVDLAEAALESLEAAHERGSETWIVWHGMRVTTYQSRARVAMWMGDGGARLTALRAGYAAMQALPADVRSMQLRSDWKASMYNLFTALQHSAKPSEVEEAVCLLRELRGASLIPGLSSPCLVCQDALGEEPSNLEMMACGEHVLHRSCAVQWADHQGAVNPVRSACPLCQDQTPRHFVTSPLARPDGLPSDT